MTTATASQPKALVLPAALRTAQAAIQSAEVQEMLCGLSVHRRGISMPHGHDDKTGEFQRLPDHLGHEEAGLDLSLRPTAKISIQAGRFLPVARVWRDGLPIPSAVCEMVHDEDAPDDEKGYVKHKYPTRN